MTNTPEDRPALTRAIDSLDGVALDLIMEVLADKEGVTCVEIVEHDRLFKDLVEASQSNVDLAWIALRALAPVRDALLDADDDDEV